MQCLEWACDAAATVPLMVRTYNPEDGRALKKPATQKQAMEELVSVVKVRARGGFGGTWVGRDAQGRLNINQWRERSLNLAVTKADS